MWTILSQGQSIEIQNMKTWFHLHCVNQKIILEYFLNKKANATSLYIK